MLSIKDSKIKLDYRNTDYLFSYSYILDTMFLDLREFLNTPDTKKLSFTVDFLDTELKITLTKFQPIGVLHSKDQEKVYYFVSDDNYVKFEGFKLRSKRLLFRSTNSVEELLKKAYVGITINSVSYPESVLCIKSGSEDIISKRLVRNIEKRIYKFWLSNSKKLALIELEREEAHKRSLIEGTAKYDVMVNYKNSKIDQLLQMVNTIENTKIRKRLSKILNSEKGFY